jgi:hypothetical protein
MYTGQWLNFTAGTNSDSKLISSVISSALAVAAILMFWGPAILETVLTVVVGPVILEKVLTDTLGFVILFESLLYRWLNPPPFNS